MLQRHSPPLPALPVEVLDPAARPKIMIFQGKNLDFLVKNGPFHV